MTIAIVTTFPNHAWDVYAKRALQSFAQFLPAETELLVQLDDDMLFRQVSAMLRPQDGIAIGWEKEHAAFVARNKDKDDPVNYRKQAVRFCHKVFALKRSLDALVMYRQSLKDGLEGLPAPRYLVWIDADVIISRPVTMEELQKCLPRSDRPVAYLGREDWDHSECGWLAFDLEGKGGDIINAVYKDYITDKLFEYEQWHDSYIWDKHIFPFNYPFDNGGNLTWDKRGMDIWPQSPMGKWSTHYKGPEAKATLLNQPVEQIIRPQRGNVIIKTKNAVPDEKIREHIAKNQELIKQWISPCEKTDEEIVFVSAGPSLIAEDLRAEQEAGRKIVAVKHAMQPLKEAGVKIWASILLDPRPHVLDFVQEIDKDIIWFVASQVDPMVTERLLDNGCTIWGYHASVNAGEGELITKQPYAIISGGSATATRGMYVMSHMGFGKFRLYGYDLCVFDKPDFNARDEYNQPKYFEISLGFNDVAYSRKRCFWTEPQLMAQFEELQEIIKLDRWEIEAFGDGIVPFIVRSKKVANLRNAERIARLIGNKPESYRELLCRNQKDSPSRLSSS